MEKQRNTSNTRFIRRLLVLFVLMFLPLKIFSQQQILTPQQAAELRVVPSENQKLYSKQDIKFEVIIPNTKASLVQIQSVPDRAGINLKTWRKTDVYGDVPGTKIELWYYFEKTGTFTLPNLGILINYRPRTIKFAPVSISENPANMLPRIVIKFSNGVVVNSDDTMKAGALFNFPMGEKISFTVYLQYISQLVQFNWDIPRDSIFTQTHSYEITEIKYREKNYSDELIPVADFEWTSLSKGIHQMPKIRLVTTAYAGYRNEISMPNFSINFIIKKVEVLEEDSFDYFDVAFDYTGAQSTENLTKQITDEQCLMLANLRSRERQDVRNHFQNVKVRQSFENEMGLPSDFKEFFIGFLYIALILLVLGCGFLILSFKKKFFLGEIFFPLFVTMTVIFNVYSLVKMSERYAISKQCVIYSIPDENAASFTPITSGTRVRISESSMEWSFIEVGENSGWCKNTDIFEIE